MGDALLEKKILRVSSSIFELWICPIIFRLCRNSLLQYIVLCFGVFDMKWCLLNRDFNE